MEQVFILSACRTPIGKINGQFSSISAANLGSAVITGCLQKAKLSPEDLDEVVIGQVFTAGQGQNTARQASIWAKVPPEVPAYTVSLVGGSGLKAIYVVYNSIRTKDSAIAFAGGQENITLSHHTVHLRTKKNFGAVTWQDTLETEGLLDPILRLGVGELSDHLAKMYDVPKQLQDEFAFLSHQRVMRALDSKFFDGEIIPVGDNSYVDECPLRGCSLELFENYSPVIEGGTVTAGNTADMADGAAGVIMISGAEAQAKKLCPEARIVAIAQTACEPIENGLASVSAIKMVLEKAKWSLQDVDLFEVDETCAAYAVLCIDILKLSLEKVNVSGGAVSLGNPLGASGVRMLVTLLSNLKRLGKNKGVVAVCAGGGIGLAIALEKC